MPAAAVIPAPRAYINVVAVKKPVVGFECRTSNCLLIYFGSDGQQVHISNALRHAGSSTGSGVIQLASGLFGGTILHHVRPQPSL